MLAIFTFWALSLLVGVSGHSSIWHPSMFGFNVTMETFPYDNRPVAPLRDRPFDQWWFHGHLDYPPHPGDVYDLQAGKPATLEIACHKGATSYFASSEGGDIRDPNNFNYPCPGAPMEAFHTNGLHDLMGCGLAIAYKSNARDVTPDDFTMFSVNHTCVWNRFTDFQVPERMPPCPEGGCVCAFFWIHSPKSGGQENYMNGFKCNVSGSTSNVPVAKSKVARRCGADPENGNFSSVPGNCTYGAKQPFYWLNQGHNNVFEGEHSPPVYNDLYNFVDGAQSDIFEDSYVSIPDPSPTAPLPVLRLRDASPSSGTGSANDNNNQGNGNGGGTSNNGSSSGSPSSDQSQPQQPNPVPQRQRKCAPFGKNRNNAELSKRDLYIPDVNPTSSTLLSQADVDELSTPRVLSPAALVAMSKRSRKLDFGRRDRIWKFW